MDKLVQDSDARVRVAVARLIGTLELVDYIPSLIAWVGGSAHDADSARAAKVSLESFLGDGLSFGFSSVEWNKWYEGEYD